MTNKDSPTALLKVYGEKLSELSLLLDGEKSAIEENKIETFTDILSKKEQILNDIAQTQNALNKLRQHMPLEAFILSIDDSQASTALLSQIKKDSLDCDTKSQVNGILIMASKQLTERLLDGLTGRKRNQTYSKKGTEPSIESTHYTRI